MNTRILALLTATLCLAGCGTSTTNEGSTVAPLPLAEVGTMRTSNDYWNAQRPYAWDDDATNSERTSSASRSSGRPLSSSTPSADVHALSDDRDWLARVGMSPEWGPDGHAYGDRNPGQIPAEEGFMPENFQYAYDNDFGFVATEQSGTSSSSGSGGRSSSRSGSSGAGSAGMTSGGGLRLPSGRTVDGQSNSSSVASGQGGLRLPSGRMVDGQTNTSSSSSGGGQTLTLPSGRTVDGESNDQAMNGTGSTVRLASGGGRGCNQPDPGGVTGGDPGVTFPVLYKGTCPVTTTILRVPDKQESVFGSMDF